MKTTFLLSGLTIFFVACGGSKASGTTAGGSSGAGSSSGSSAGSSSGSSAGSGATALSSGDGYGIVYDARGNTGTAWIGIDLRPNVSATFATDGSLSAYHASDNEHLDVGAATSTLAGSDGVAMAGTWKGGPTAGKFYAAKPAGDFTFDALSGVFHFGLCKATASDHVPTSGTATYKMSFATKPTNIPDIAEGTTTDFTVVADFAASTVSTTLVGSVGGSNGGSLALSGEAGTINASFEHGFDANTADFAMRGVFCGDDASEAVVSFEVKGTVLASGAAVLVKQ